METMTIELTNHKVYKLLKELEELRLIRILKESVRPTEKGISLSDFSFSKSQKNLEKYKGSFSDAVVEERRLEL
jgi:hypothetical protein